MRYLQRLHVDAKPRNRMTVAEQQALWREVFPSLPLGDIDSEVRQWLIARERAMASRASPRDHGELTRRRRAPTVS